MGDVCIVFISPFIIRISGPLFYSLHSVGLVTDLIVVTVYCCFINTNRTLMETNDCLFINHTKWLHLNAMFNKS